MVALFENRLDKYILTDVYSGRIEGIHVRFKAKCVLLVQRFRYSFMSSTISATSLTSSLNTAKVGTSWITWTDRSCALVTDYRNQKHGSSSGGCYNAIWYDTIRLAQPLSDKIWVNRAICGKTPYLAHMYIIPNQVNLAIMPSQIFPVGTVAVIFQKWPLCHHISETKRRRAIIVDSIII